MAAGIAGLDMASATLKMNDDGSFNLLAGATDLGTGSDTILAQIAAEELQIPVEDFIVYSSDTDFTPFDKGAYASSTTYISGGAVARAAKKAADMVREHAAAMLEISDPGSLKLKDRAVHAPDGRSVTFAEVALSSLHSLNQHQIIASASHMSTESPPPTAAQFVELAVDIETGEIKVERLLMVVDAGRVINPITAAGQVEGGVFKHSALPTARICCMAVTASRSTRISTTIRFTGLMKCRQWMRYSCRPTNPRDRSEPSRWLKSQSTESVRRLSARCIMRPVCGCAICRSHRNGFGRRLKSV